MRTRREWLGDVASSTVLAIALVACVLAVPKVAEANWMKDITDTWCRGFPGTGTCPQVPSRWIGAPRGAPDTLQVAPAPTQSKVPVREPAPSAAVQWWNAPSG